MSIKKQVMLLVPIIAIVLGCHREAENQLTNGANQRGNNQAVVSDHFKEQYHGARMFVELYREAERLFGLGEYEQSIKTMEKGYECCASNRAAKSMALEQMSLSYEALGKYDVAANMIEASGDMSMNPEQKEEFYAKAKSFRSKAAALRAKLDQKQAAKLPSSE